ncbi:MAG: SRPBCC domain-containing protein, partial [Betaproteobacteria bacterium]|nr:SRPBCC domain-containing protein [Betaproteobacteria bacterium]
MKRTVAALLVAALPLAAVAQERAIVKISVVAAPLEAVWKAWTTTEGIRTFFAPDARVEPRPGGPFEIYFNPYAKAGLKGGDDMVVLAVQ